MVSEKKKEVLRVVKFVMFSISAGIIEIVSFTILNEFTGWKYWPCYLIALILSVLWNFTLNRKFTFNVPVAMAKIALFYCVFTPVTTIMGNYLAEDLLWNDYIVTGINMGLNITTEYLYDRFVVFRKSIDTNKLAMRDRADNRQQ